MKAIDAICRTILILLVGIILGASWVLSELSPQIDRLVQENLSQDSQIRLLKTQHEIGRVKRK